MRKGTGRRTAFDEVQYLISANPGEPLGPVEEIASGGELSRVMLALKTTIEAGGDRNECGRTGPKGGSRAANAGVRRDRLRNRWARGRGRRQETQATRRHQASVMHHALAADRILRRPALPDREEGDPAGRTKTSVRQLDTEERTRELARMISGAKLTDTSHRARRADAEDEPVKLVHPVCSRHWEIRVGHHSLGSGLFDRGFFSCHPAQQADLSVVVALVITQPNQTLAPLCPSTEAGGTAREHRCNGFVAQSLQSGNQAVLGSSKALFSRAMSTALAALSKCRRTAPVAGPFVLGTARFCRPPPA